MGFITNSAFAEECSLYTHTHTKPVDKMLCEAVHIFPAACLTPDVVYIDICCVDCLKSCTGKLCGALGGSSNGFSFLFVYSIKFVLLLMIIPNAFQVEFWLKL